jgi:hypothetical protein
MLHTTLPFAAEMPPRRGSARRPTASRPAYQAQPSEPAATSVGTSEEVLRVTATDLPRWVSELQSMLRRRTRESLPESVALAWLKSNPAVPMLQGAVHSYACC